MTGESDADRAEPAGEVRTSDGQSLFSEPIRTFPWLQTGLAGAATFLVEYVLVALVFVVGPASVQVDTIRERLTSYTFVLFGTHHVPVVRSADGVTLPLPARQNIVTSQTDPSIPIVVYLAIPVVALLIAGAVLGLRRRDAVGSTVERSVLVGMGLAAGYVVVGMATALIFVDVTHFDPGSITQRVSPLAAFLATAIYPLLLGTASAFAVLSGRPQA